MEIRMIATFLKVAATQNFSKAAEQLGYSQSAVTVQIQKLEQELDVPLFERIGKRVYLTEKGRDFIPYANELLRASNAALGFAREETAPKGRLRIGGVESVCTALLPELLLEFYRLCPQVEVVLRSGITTELMDLADSNELDLVLTLDEKIFRSDLQCHVEKEEEVVLVTLRDEKHHPGDVIPMEALCRQPFILTEKGAPYRHALDSILALRELEIRPILEIGNTETIINLLKKGMGISYLPRFTVEQELKAGTLMELDSDIPPVRMYLQLLYHKSKWLTRPMEIFMELVEKYCRKMR